MKLYGTTTSPFVRRVLIVAAEVGEAVERVDTATEAGLAEIALVTALDWMDFRSAFPTDGAPGLTRVRAAFRDHPSVASTVPRE